LVETTHLTQVDTIFRVQMEGVHLCFIMSPGKMIFAILEL